MKLFITGIYNYEEYLLVRDTEEAEKERGLTLKRAHQSGGLVGTLRDADKMEKLRKELHTDDEGERWHFHIEMELFSISLADAFQVTPCIRRNAVVTNVVTYFGLSFLTPW